MAGQMLPPPQGQVAEGDGEQGDAKQQEGLSVGHVREHEQDVRGHETGPGHQEAPEEDLLDDAGREADHQAQQDRQASDPENHLRLLGGQVLESAGSADDERRDQDRGEHAGPQQHAGAEPEPDFSRQRLAGAGAQPELARDEGSGVVAAAPVAEAEPAREHDEQHGMGREQAERGQVLEVDLVDAGWQADLADDGEDAHPEKQPQQRHGRDAA